MDPRKEISEKDGEFEVPKGLVEDLRAVFGRSVQVGPEVDESILAMARACLSQQKCVKGFPLGGVATYNWASS